MKLKIFQLNIQCGVKLEEIIAYCKEQNFDVIHFQEVGGGDVSYLRSDNFSVLIDSLSMEGKLTISTQKKDDPSSYYGNATFYKPNLELISQEVIWLKPFQEFDAWIIGGEFAKELPRNALALQFKYNEKIFWSINTHLAWGPTPFDEPYKIKQVLKLQNFVKKIKNSFILTGDFNITKDSEIVRGFDKIAVNHAVQAGLINTLNPHLHRVRQLFPPGLAVDFIYTSFDLEADNFELVDSPDLSDHYGLKISITI
jgi:endonuclease/exonuclease/phosphatase family metal-dependent hydrolase